MSPDQTSSAEIASGHVGALRHHRKAGAEQQREQGEELALHEHIDKGIGPVVDALPVHVDAGERQVQRATEGFDVHQQDAQHRGTTQDVQHGDAFAGSHRLQGGRSGVHGASVGQVRHYAAGPRPWSARAGSNNRTGPPTRAAAAITIALRSVVVAAVAVDVAVVDLFLAGFAHIDDFHVEMQVLAGHRVVQVNVDHAHADLLHGHRARAEVGLQHDLLARGQLGVAD
ncbi:hypothetical protein G6F46_013439 [Rhizopus delemar]|nr:hypothetical protein G6F46_013439 [Rhizopus delemar]